MTQRVVDYTYGTGNPVLPDGSIDVRDGIDNLQSMDVFMNAPEDTYNQRDGEIVRTVAGMNNEFDAQILNMGFTRIGTFAAGATITNPRQTLLWDIADGGDGQEYGWSGAFPKVVPETSTPASTGGISVGAWMSRFDPELRVQVREALRRSYAEAGYNAVGTFQGGFTIVNANDVGIDLATGKGYTGPAGPVAAGTNPASGGFVDQSGNIAVHLGSYTALRAYSGGSARVYCTGRENVFDGASGWFFHDVNNTNGVDNDGTLLVDTLGRRWRRQVIDPALPEWFGAKGDGVTDDTAATQAAVDTVWNAGGGVVYASKGSYLVTATIDIFKGTAKRIQLKGAGIWVTRFITSLDIVVFQHAEFTTFTDFSVAQAGTIRTGRAFSTPTTKQAAYCIYERINATNFKFGIWWRYSLWSSLRDVTFTNCAVGVKASRNSSPDDQPNPANTGGWNNWNNGFFHNQNTFQNVLCDGGEVGIWGTFHGTTFDNVTCQGQRSADGATNVAAPVGTPGIGLWLQNDGNGTSTYGAQGNNIVNYYAEATRQPMVFEYVRVALGAFFAQGGTSADPYPQVLKVTGGEVNALGCSASGADWFSKHVVLTNCRVLGDVQVGAVNGNVSSVTNSVWQQKISAPAKNFNLTHNGATTTAIEALAARSTYTVVVGALYDGYLVKSAQFEVYHYQGGLSRVMSHPSNTADITCTVSGDTLNLNTTGTATYLLRGTVIRNNALGQYPYTAS